MANKAASETDLSFRHLDVTIRGGVMDGTEDIGSVFLPPAVLEQPHFVHVGTQEGYTILHEDAAAV